MAVTQFGNVPKSVLNSRNIINLVIKDIRTRILGESIGQVKETWAKNNVI